MKTRKKLFKDFRAIVLLSTIMIFLFSFDLYAQDKLLMGVTGSITGVTAGTWPEVWAGCKTAEAIINESGGINGTKVEIVALDDQLEKVQSVNNFKKFAGMKNMLVVVGGGTGVTQAMVPLAERFKLCLVGGAALGPLKFNDWTFRIPIPDQITIPFMFKAMKAKYGIKTVGMMYDYKDDWSVNCIPTYKKAASDNGLETPIAPQSFGRGDTDFSAQLTNLKTANLDAILLPAMIREGSIIIKQGRGLGLKSIFCGTSAVISIEGLSAAGDAADGVVAVTIFHPSSKKPGAVTFYKKFQELFPGEKVKSYVVSCNYDSLILAAEAARRAKIKPPVTEKDRIRMRDEWAKIKGFEGASGIFTFEGPGDPLPRDGILVRYSAKDKNFHLID